MNGPLITPDDLHAKIGAPGLVVLDIRSAVDGGGRTAYEAGHIPGTFRARSIPITSRAVGG